jgi:hypothetical protein
MNERNIDKKHIATAILFAVKHVPDTDKVTLHKFLELVNTTGSIGWMPEQQLLAEMKLILNRVPGTSQESLLTVLELSEVCVPLHPGRYPMPPLLHQRWWLKPCFTQTQRRRRAQIGNQSRVHFQ